jgi:hypothetical protein
LSRNEHATRNSLPISRAAGIKREGARDKTSFQKRRDLRLWSAVGWMGVLGSNRYRAFSKGDLMTYDYYLV